MTTLPAMHLLWLREIRSAFQPACVSGATVWDRARAVTYLRERFLPRFRSEREAATNLVALLQPDRRRPLWASGDQIEIHAERLARLATFHQKAGEFNEAAVALVRAVEAWCAALEIAADQVREIDLLPV